MNYKISNGTLWIAPFVVMLFLPGVGVLFGLVCFVLWIAGKICDAQVKQAMKGDSASGKIRLHVPEIRTPASRVDKDF